VVYLALKSGTIEPNMSIGVLVQNMNTARSGYGWPRSAKVVVGVLMTLLLAAVGFEFVGRSLLEGTYKPETGGTIADWFSSIAALFAVPLSLWIMRSQLNLQRRELLDGQLERLGREEQSLRLAKANLTVEVLPKTVIECQTDLTQGEATQVAKWRQEMKHRGWVEEERGAFWVNGVATLSTSELVEREPTSVLDKPWALFVECRNLHISPVEIKRVTIQPRSGKMMVEEPAGRFADANAVVSWRIRPERGRMPAFADSRSAVSFAREVTVAVESLDGHKFAVSTREMARG
jgi:hypothetical protein